MSQFKTTSSISPSISAPIAQGEVVGVGVKRRGGGVLEVTKGDAKQKNVSFWAACEVNACLGKSPWHVTDQHQQQGEAPEIARNQMPSSNSLFRVIRNSEVKLFLDQRCIAVSCFPTLRQRRCRYPTAPSSPNNCHAGTPRGPHFQIEMYRWVFYQYPYGCRLSTLTLYVQT